MVRRPRHPPRGWASGSLEWGGVTPSVNIRRLRREPSPMPRISAFHGILIYLYYQDHGPPHFHAIHGREQAAVEIRSGEVVAGRLRGRDVVLVRQWARRHRAELLANWQRARSGLPVRRIAPLP
ncbi:MAG: DUF4160 domain-containing protein [Planctomycetota bacterium]